MPTLHQFIEDEMLRAPLIFDQVVDSVVHAWRSNLPVQGARSTADPSRSLNLHRRELVQSAVQELGRMVTDAANAPGVVAPSSGAAMPRPELSLLDDDAVSMDIEVSRAIEAVHAEAETELRDLRAYASTLTGDPHVSRDANPFKPESFVRALWIGVQQAPLSPGHQAAFLREAARPLAQVLRRAYAAASARLHESGVTPAAHRTIVSHDGTRTLSDVGQPDTAELSDMLDSMPMPLQDTQPGALPDAAPGAAVGGVDQQLIELLSRLFDAIQSDRQLESEALSLLLRLHPTALRAALREPAMLDSYEHPVWLFMDRVAFIFDTAPRATLERTVALVRHLVDDLVADRSGTAERFNWALSRLAAFERKLLEQSTQEAEAAVQHLAEREQREAGNTTVSAPPLDIATLDTVPAGLMHSEAAQPQVLGEARVGDWFKAYLQGDWRQLLLLWQGAKGQTWLMCNPRTGQQLALRRTALERLAHEGLAKPLQVRSLVRAAAARVLRDLAP